MFFKPDETEIALTTPDPMNPGYIKVTITTEKAEELQKVERNIEALRILAEDFREYQAEKDRAAAFVKFRAQKAEEEGGMYLGLSTGIVHSHLENHDLDQEYSHRKILRDRSEALECLEGRAGGERVGYEAQAASTPGTPIAKTISIKPRGKPWWPRQRSTSQDPAHYEWQEYVHLPAQLASQCVPYYTNCMQLLKHASTASNAPGYYAVPAVEFQFFPYLPSELQIKIWNYSLPIVRMVAVVKRRRFPHSLTRGIMEQIREPSAYQHTLTRERYFRLRYFDCKAPAMLHVCSTSRQIALKHYKPVFEDFGLLRRLPPLYVNFERDVFFLPNDFGYMHTWWNSSDNDTENVRRVAVRCAHESVPDNVDGLTLGKDAGIIIAIMMRFFNLTSIYYIKGFAKNKEESEKWDSYMAKVLNNADFWMHSVRSSLRYGQSGTKVNIPTISAVAWNELSEILGGAEIGKPVEFTINAGCFASCS